MLTERQVDSARARARKFFAKAGVVLTAEESANIEVADFGLGELDQSGLQIVTYVNTNRVCAKELVLFPRQTCPEHCHPPVDNDPGKEETFRCRWGTAYLYVAGAPVVTREDAQAKPPTGREQSYTVWHEVILQPGEQYTVSPNTLHWFQAGPNGAVVSEFSTRSRDETDVFTDPQIKRIPVIRG